MKVVLLAKMSGLELELNLFLFTCSLLLLVAELAVLNHLAQLGAFDCFVNLVSMCKMSVVSVTTTKREIKHILA